MSDNMGNDASSTNEGSATTTSTNNSASNERTFTQSELDAIVTKRLSQVEKKYSSINIEEYNQMKAEREAKETEAALKRQEFDKVLGQVKSAADAKIQALQKELETIKIDGSLIAEASQRRAVAPDKVAALLRSQMRLNSEGQVEVLDNNGQVRYNADKATPMAISDVVDEFLKSNPYFLAANPAGSGSRNAGQEAGIKNIDLTSLDMRKAEHRELYRKYKANQKQ